MQCWYSWAPTKPTPAFDWDKREPQDGFSGGKADTQRWMVCYMQGNFNHNIVYHVLVHV